MMVRIDVATLRVIADLLKGLLRGEGVPPLKKGSKAKMASPRRGWKPAPLFPYGEPHVIIERLEVPVNVRYPLDMADALGYTRRQNTGRSQWLQKMSCTWMSAGWRSG
jgi:hypothetical protein